MHPLISYLPYNFTQDLLLHPGLSPIGRHQRFEAVALFVDISGFTLMSENLAKAGKAGTEELTALLNRYFGSMIELSYSYGGNIAKFGGDSMTVLFRCNFPTREDAVRRALLCALDMQAQMVEYLNIKTSVGTFSLSMKAGLAIGTVYCTSVGEVGVRFEYLVAGSVLERSADAEHHARPGDVVIHNDLQLFARGFNFEPVSDNFSLVSKVEKRPGTTDNLTPPPSLFLSALIPPDSALFGPTTGVMANYLHPAIAERLGSGQTGFLNEHRKVTVIFVRFGGFDYDNDPDVGQKLQQYLVEVIRTVHGYDGYLKQVDMGDKGSKIIIMFGAPVAHENDEERALRCALDLLNLARNEKIETETGISTGQVFCGMFGSDVRQEYAAIGDAVNAAARLMQTAQPGQILVSGFTQRYVSEKFGWEPLEPVRLKGKTELMSLFELAGMRRRRGISGRLSEPAYGLPMVGRKNELNQIAELLELSKLGSGQIVGICAAAGMGKSRLAAEVMRIARQKGVVWLSGECMSYGQTASYAAWQRILRDLFQLDDRWDIDMKARQLEKELEKVDPQYVGLIPLLGLILNLPVAESELTRGMDARLRKDALENMLVDFIRYRAKASPIMLVLEDCHWIDPLSHDLLTAVARRTVDIPVFILAIYRPPEEQAETGQEQLRITRLRNFTEIKLGEFTRKDTEQLIMLKLAQIFGQQVETPAELVERISERAQGTPFYIDEMVNLLRDRGINLTDRTSLKAIVLPESLQSLIISRIDQLHESEKIVVKIASVLGRIFVASWLWGAFPELGGKGTVQETLGKLSRVELITLDKHEPEIEYIFKHIVTRDVAYESLAYATRAAIHEKLARFLESRYAENLERWLDVLAYHYEQSQNSAKQREFYWRAGDAAQKVYANDTAIEYYQKLLPLLDGPEEVDIMLKLGQIWQLVGKWTAAEQIYREALNLSVKLNDDRTIAECQNSLGLLFYLKGEYEQALEWLDKARAGFEALGFFDKVNLAISYMGNVSLQQGEFTLALSCCQQWLKLASESGNNQEVYQALSFMGNVYMQQGDYSEALACYKRWMRTATNVGNKQQAAATIGNMGRAYWLLGDGLSSVVCYEQQLLTAATVGDRRLISLACANMGEIYRRVGDYQRALVCHARQLEVALEIGNPSLILTALGYIGAIFNAQGEDSRAASFYRRAVALGRNFKVNYYLAEFLYADAEMNFNHDRLDKALDKNREAMALAEEVDYEEIRFKATVQGMRLRLASNELTLEAALAELESLLPVWSGAEEQAALHYELWSLDKNREQDCLEASRLYKELYNDITDTEFSRRYRDLTGESLPETFFFPELPEYLTRHPADLDELVDRVDHLLA